MEKLSIISILMIFSFQKIMSAPPSVELDWPAEERNAKVCLWKDNKTAALSLTVDDNIKPDHEWWIEQSKIYNLKVTWFIIIHWLKDNPQYFGTWNDFRRLYSLGHSVQSHTISHNHRMDTLPDNLVEYEYRESKKMIEDSIPGNRCLTLAYPNNYGKPSIASKYYIASRSAYGRPICFDGGDLSNTNAGDLTKEWIDYTLFEDSKNLQYFRGWNAPLFHGLTEERKKNLTEIFKYIHTLSDKLWVNTYDQIALYLIERKNSKLNVLNNVNGCIRLSLTDNLPDSIYNIPLSIVVCLGSDENIAVVAKQNNRELLFKKVYRNSKLYVLFDAVPDQGEILVLYGKILRSSNVSEKTLKKIPESKYTATTLTGRIINKKGENPNGKSAVNINVLRENKKNRIDLHVK
jgi:peptidoglycan/xylan/chitin deacetylase (PgdA/CDA1 family)